MSDTGLDRELQAALDVDPSPEFLTRVRRRVAREPAPAPWWYRRELAVVAAGLLVAAGLWTVSPQPVHEIPSSRGLMATSAPPVVTMEVPWDLPAPVAASPVIPQIARHAPERQPVREDDLPPVVLAENERAALRMLGAATRIEPPEPAEITVSAERSDSVRPELASVRFDVPDIDRPMFEAVSFDREGDRP